jgi:serine phosphatase RsbU (regulator of sigma subunit)
LADAAYQSANYRLDRGDRLVLVTDGVTEAENSAGEFFENERLEAAARAGDMRSILAAVAEFRGNTPLGDDCTVVELVFSGP